MGNFEGSDIRQNLEWILSLTLSVCSAFDHSHLNSQTYSYFDTVLTFIHLIARDEFL